MIITCEAGLGATGGGPAMSGRPVRLVVFDFDQTLSVTYVCVYIYIYIEREREI